jgi:hypothetical protein
MASKTSATEMKRKRKLKYMGVKRKAKLRNQGSTKSPGELFGDEKKN